MKEKKKPNWVLIGVIAVVLVIVITISIMFNQESTIFDIPLSTEPSTTFHVNTQGQWDGQSLKLNVMKVGFSRMLSIDVIKWDYLFPLKHQFDVLYANSDIIADKSKCKVTIAWGRCFQYANNIGCSAIPASELPEETILMGTFRETGDEQIYTWTSPTGSYAFYYSPYLCELDTPYPANEVYSIPTITQIGSEGYEAQEVYKTASMDIELLKYEEEEPVLGCTLASDCIGRNHTDCSGDWSCTSNTCIYECSDIIKECLVDTECNTDEKCNLVSNKCEKKTNPIPYIVAGLLILFIVIIGILIRTTKKGKRSK
jgi:hypothetical protein